MDIKKTFEEAKYKAKRGAEVVCNTAANLGRSFVEFAKENPSAAIGIAVPVGVAANIDKLLSFENVYVCIL